MNKVFLLGTVLTDPTFDFLYKKKNMSISTFLLKTKKDNIIQVYGYDDNADFLYRNIIKGDNVLITGYLSSGNHNILVNISKIKKII